MNRVILLSAAEVARFWSGVDKSGGPDACWPWLRSCDGGGYGVMSLGVGRRKTHRISYTLAYGPIEPGVGFHGTCVTHGCDNPPCCNPRHLRLDTQAGNMQECASKGRLGIQRYPERYPDTAQRSIIHSRAAHRGEAHWARRLPERVRRGERHPAARLSDVAVEEIKQERAGGEKVRIIAGRYGVSVRHIFKILSGSRRSRKAVV